MAVYAPQSPSWPEDATVWDAHGCLPLRPGASLEMLEVYRISGFHFVSINVGMDFNSLTETMRTLAWMRDWISHHSDKYLLAAHLTDVFRAKKTGKLAIAFDLEGVIALGEDPLMLDLFSELGVRQVLLAYNNDNSCAGGCLGDGRGLSELGRQMVKRMNQVGIVVDLSHLSERAALETLEIAAKPCVFSHSNPAAMFQHPRNISDHLMRAIAEKDGVIGINGVERFLGGSTSSESIVRHIDYVVNLVGWRHVGLGLDHVFDQDELIEFMRAHPDRFPTVRFKHVDYVKPEQLGEIQDLLHGLGYGEEARRGILGENFMRVAGEVWR